VSARTVVESAFVRAGALPRRSRDRIRPTPFVYVVDPTSLATMIARPWGLTRTVRVGHLPRRHSAIFPLLIGQRYAHRAAETDAAGDLIKGGAAPGHWPERRSGSHSACGIRRIPDHLKIARVRAGSAGEHERCCLRRRWVGRMRALCLTATAEGSNTRQQREFLMPGRCKEMNSSTPVDRPVCDWPANCRGMETSVSLGATASSRNDPAR
jgi:hypothetical protein